MEGIIIWIYWFAGTLIFTSIVFSIPMALGTINKTLKEIREELKKINKKE